MKFSQHFSQLKSHWEVPRDDIVEDLLNPVFEKSDRVDIMAGFYSSSAIRELAYGICELIKNPRGKLRIICSEYLDKKDIPDDSFLHAQKVIDDLFLNEEGMADALIRYTRECISYLYHLDRVQIKIAVNPKGLFHKKVYLFSSEDSHEGMALIGSANFSFGGFKKNNEILLLGKNWEINQDSSAWYATQINDFESIWSDNSPGLYVYDIREAQLKSILQYASKDVQPIPPSELFTDDLSQASQDLLEQKFQIPPSLNWQFGDYSHQGRAVHAWEENNRRGIISIATGGGKTKTALICAARLKNEISPLHIIIVVPTKVLAIQWISDCHDFGLVNTFVDLKASVDERVKHIYDNIEAVNLGICDISVSIVLNGTLSNSKFRQVVSKAKVNQLLIADECHNLGTENILSSLPENVEYRLGLSATPVRQYDSDGTSKLFEYFGHGVYEFGLKDAIGVCLVPYEYYIHPVFLNEAECQEIEQITLRIKRLSAIAKNSSDESLGKELDRLRIKRGSIIEAAENKVAVFEQLFSGLPQQQKKLALVFCTSKNQDQLLDVENVMQRLSIKYRQVTQLESSDATKLEQIIGNFQNGTIDVLLAKKVLDEGANIPQIQNAFFLGSTSTEREWIQRRGRVLRKCQNKSSAVIHDFIAIPLPEYSAACKSVFTRELARCLEFSQFSLNRLDPDGGRMVLESLRSRYGF